MQLEGIGVTDRQARRGVDLDCRLPSISISTDPEGHGLCRSRCAVWCVIASVFGYHMAVRMRRTPATLSAGTNALDDNNHWYRSRSRIRGMVVLWAIA